MSQTYALSQSETPKPRNEEEELGYSITLPLHTGPDGRNELLEREYGSVSRDKLAEMMKKDGQTRALKRLITLPILSALKNATVTPTDGGDAEAEFTDKMLTLPPQAGGMTKPIHRFIAELLEGTVLGFQAFEEVYHIPEGGDLDGKWTLRKMARRPSQTVTFVLDDNGGFAGIKQRGEFKGKTIDIFIPRDKALYWAANEEENPFYGVSYFLPAFYHWDKKVKLYYIAHLAATWAAVPGRKGTYPKNATPKEKAEFKDKLEKFGLAQAIMLEAGWEFDELKAGSSSFNYIEHINHQNSQMSKSVLAGFLDEENKQTLVDFSENKNALYIMELEAIMDDVASNINSHTLPKFIDWNFDSKKYPTWSFGPIDDNTQRLMIDAFKALLTASKGASVTPEFTYEIEKGVAAELDLAIDYDSLDDEFEEKKAQAKEMDQAALDEAKGKAAVAGQPPVVAPPGAKPPSGAPAKVPKVAAVAASAEQDPELVQLATDILEELRHAGE